MRERAGPVQLLHLPDVDPQTGQVLLVGGQMKGNGRLGVDWSNEAGYTRPMVR